MKPVRTPSCTGRCWPTRRRARGWEVHLFDAKDVESKATKLLGPRADDVLYGPRKTLGSPWGKDHRMALAATIVAGATLHEDTAG